MKQNVKKTERGSPLSRSANEINIVMNYEGLKPLGIGLVCRKGLAPCEAEPLVHEVMMSFVGRRRVAAKKFRKRFLRRLMSRFCSAYRRQAKYRTRFCALPEFHDEMLFTPPKVDRWRDIADALPGALNQLSPRLRLVIDGRYFDDLSFFELAQRTGINQSTLKVDALRARRKLRDILRAKIPNSAFATTVVVGAVASVARGKSFRPSTN